MGATIDANGWSVFTPSSAGWGEGSSYTGTGLTTRIIYVSTSGDDMTGDGTFGNPFFSPEHGATFLRDGHPDWLLLRKGDVWTNHAPGIIEISGQDIDNPLLFSSYDPAAGHSPPVPNPYTGGNRPEMHLSLAWYPNTAISFNGNPFNAIAVVGLKFYAYTRDPANVGSFDTTTSQVTTPGIGFESEINGFLLEDCWVGYFGGGFGAANNAKYGRCQNLFLRRNEIVSNYPGNSAQPNEGVGIFIAVDGGPSGHVYYQNVFDKNGWNSDSPITWSGPTGFSHNVYVAGEQINGDPASQSSPITFDGNVLTNEGNTSAFRVGGLYTNNLLMQSPRGLSIHQPHAFNSTIYRNVVLNPVLNASAIGITGIEAESRYITENPTVGTATWNSNILSSSLIDTTFAQGLVVNNGLTGQTVTGNYIYNWSIGDPTNAVIATTGGVYAGSITAGGTGYADLSSSILSAASSNTGYTSGSFTWASDNQDYIVLTLAPGGAANIGESTALYSTSGPLTGLYSAAISDWGAVGTITPITGGGTGLGLVNGTYDSTDGGVTHNGIPVFNTFDFNAAFARVVVSGGLVSSVTLTNGGQGCQVGQTLIVLASQLGSVTSSASINVATVATALDDHIILYGTSFTGGGGSFSGTVYYPYYQTTLSNFSGSMAGSGFQADLFSVGGSIVAYYLYGSDLHDPVIEKDNSPGSSYVAGDVLTSTVGGGSGFRFHVDLLCNNTTTPNFIDAVGDNHLSFADPNRSAGSYYATGGSGAWTPTANQTFTGHITAGTLTIDSGSPTLNLGDAITWSGQTSADYIKSGTGPTTYTMAGTQTVSSRSMSSYTAQQLINLQRNQSKATWSTALTAPAVNQYIAQGFGLDWSAGGGFPRLRLRIHG